MGSPNEPSSPISPNSLKQRLKSLRLPCFHHHDHREVLSAPSSPVATPKHPHHKPRLERTLSYSGVKSPNIKDKCCGFLSQIRHGSRLHSSSVNFRYDPLSYSLNFDDGDDSQYDEFPLRNFSARLRPSSPPSASASASA